MKKVILIPVLLALALTTASCLGPSPREDIDYKDIFSFTCPEGWKVTDTDDYVYAHIIVAEKDGLK